MSLLLRQLWYGGLLLPPVVQDDTPTPPGPSPIGKHIIGVASGARNGKLLIATQPTRCEATQIGDVYLGLVSGVRDEKPLMAVVDQRCDGGELQEGQTYLGLVSGVRDDKPLLVVPCSTCGDEQVILCDLQLSGNGQIATVVAPGRSTPSGMEAMFSTWNGLPLSTGQELLSDVSFNNYDFLMTLLSTTLGAPPYFQDGNIFRQPTVFGICSSNVTARAWSRGYQTPWTSFDSGAKQFKHVYMVSKLRRTVIAPPTTLESCAYFFWTFVRTTGSTDTSAWGTGFTTGVGQTNWWCDEAAPRISTAVSLSHAGTCGPFPAGPSHGFAPLPLASGSGDGTCMLFYVGAAT